MKPLRPFLLAAIVALAWAATAAPEPTTWGLDAFDPTEYFAAAELAEWKALANRHRLLALIGLPLALLFNAAFALTPFAARLRDRTRRVSERLATFRPFRTAPARRIGAALRRLFGDDVGGALLFTYAYLLAGTLLGLPLALVGEWLSQDAGLSNYSALSWTWDLVKAETMSAAAYTCVVVGLFGLIRRMPNRWWLVLGLPAAVFMVVYGLVEPYKQRAFFEFHPLEAPALRARLEGLAAREGLAFDAIKVADASRVTNTLNAYIAGVGPSRELVLFDTLVEALTPNEIAVAVAHELGHQRNRSTTLRYVLSGLALLAVMWMASRLLLRGPRWFGFDGPGDVRGLPLLALVMTLLLTGVRPVSRAYDRYEERRADRVALTLTGDPEAFVSLQVKLARQNKADVVRSPWVDLWFASHPSPYERLATARWYRGWLSGRSGAEGSPADGAGRAAEVAPGTEGVGVRPASATGRAPR